MRRRQTRCALGTGVQTCAIPIYENRDAIELLKTHVAPVQADIAQTCPKLHVRSEYLNELFEDAYPKIKGLLDQGRYRSVLFNLDQCGEIGRASCRDRVCQYV